MVEINQIVSDTRAYSCLDCGRCTVACPIARYNPDYSPRKLVYRTVRGNRDELMEDNQLWSCLTCSMCEERCHSGVRYTELVKSLRTEAYAQGKSGQCTHGGALQSLMHIMTAGKLNQDRLRWVDKSLKVAAQGDTLYFSGCQPYFDVIFADIGVKTLDTARGTVKLLNRLDIAPVLLPNERCCGHDLLWAGDREGFIKLAQHNLKQINKAKAKKIVTTCAECYYTLKFDYPRYLGSQDFEVLHISQVLAEPIASGKLKFRRLAQKATYHDPCRLGRLAGIYDEPRTMARAIPGLELAEMSRNRANALCCGTQAWMNCGSVNKQIQSERLREAKAAGAKVLLTACPKCQIHLKCALNDKKLSGELNIQVEDVTALAAKALIK
ncbi:MAG: (Fe-S)-binding protein [Dehalococcoidales bacterium]|nr:(Fe-S)-binding protein [Dehalococcoidales bacterium]